MTDVWMAEWDGDTNDLNFQPYDKSYSPPKNPRWKVLGKVTDEFVLNYIENEHERRTAGACR
jgi:hypothetical protein